MPDRRRIEVRVDEELVVAEYWHDDEQPALLHFTIISPERYMRPDSPPWQMIFRGFDNVELQVRDEITGFVKQRRRELDIGSDSEQEDRQP